MQKIIDIHTHAFPKAVALKAVANIGDHYSINMSGTGMFDDLIKSAQKANVTYVVVHSTATKHDQVKNINSWVAKHTGGMIIGFGTLHPDMTNVEDELERIISLGLKGIKLHPDFQGFNADDPSMDRIYSAMENRLPLLIHAGDERLCGSSPQRIANVLKKFPKLTVIAAHLGGHKQWKEAWESLIGKNLYLDTSSALEYMDSETATRLIKAHGTKKVVFGTDYPVAYHDDELERFYKLNLDDEQRTDILYNNAAKLLKI